MQKQKSNGNYYLNCSGLGVGSGLTFALLCEKPKSDFYTFINKPFLNSDKKITLFNNLLDIAEFLIDSQELQFFKPEFLFIDKNDKFKLLYLGNYLFSENSNSNINKNIHFNEGVKIFKEYELCIAQYWMEFVSFFDHISSINNELTLQNIMEIKYIQDLISIYICLFSKTYKDVMNSNNNILNETNTNVQKLIPTEIKEVFDKFLNKDLFEIALNKNQYTIKILREEFLNNFKRKKSKINYYELNSNKHQIDLIDGLSRNNSILRGNLILLK